jgi:alpha-beta hydrolase superfamily lysophospholipase
VEAHQVLEIVIVLLVTVSVCVIGFHFLLLLGFRAPRVIEKKTPAALGVAFEPLSIVTQNNRLLNAWFLPGNPDSACVIVMHGWGGNAELMLPVCLPFLDTGLNVLVLDARGHGLSEGDHFSSLPKFAEDVEACIDWLHGQVDRWNGRLVLLGHSVGAGAVLLAASRDARVDAVISIAAFSHPRSMMQRYLRRFPSPLRALIIQQVERTIGHTLDEIAPLNTIRRIKCPILVAHGLDDDTVPAQEARTIMANADSQLATMLLIKGARHDSVEAFLESGDKLIAFLQSHEILEAKY